MSNDTQQRLRQDEMAHYDRLPKNLRRALDEADYKFMSSIYYRDWRRGHSCAELVRDVKTLNRNEVLRRDRMKADGKIPNDG